MMIEIKDLHHIYPGGVEALKGISLNINKGEIMSIIGQNGAGKTTLCKHFNGLLKPSSGKVIVDGIDTSNAKVCHLATKVGHVFQNPDHQIFCDSVWDEVAFGPKNCGLSGKELEDSIVSSLEAVELLSLKDRHPYSLSKGQRQRLALASVLATNPSILVVDEPTTGQDYKQTRQIMDVINKIHSDGCTIILVTHDMDVVAEYSERVVVMALGEIVVDGPVREVMTNISILKDTYLNPTQITVVGKKLGFANPLLTVDEAFKEICTMHYIESEPNKSKAI